MSIAQSAPAIKKATGTVIRLSGRERDRVIASYVEKARKDMASALDEGIEIGRQEEKFTIARNLLRAKITHDVIVVATGLSLSEINKLAAEQDED